jgi:SAM-dependent methyltransferase
MNCVEDTVCYEMGGRKSAIEGFYMAEQSLLSFVKQLIVCPLCKGELDYLPSLIKCSSCNLNFPQATNEWLDLLPSSLLDQKSNHWEKRQQEMENWYKKLIVTPSQAGKCLSNDYAPFSSYLAKLPGIVLDIGGGIGIVRNYLPPDTKYIVIDPSLEWLGTEWTTLAEHFPCLETKPCFVHGIGEYLPFLQEVFDSVLAFWSLNHTNDPQLVFREVGRVLKPNGRFLVVLEDMVPSWRDLADKRFPAREVFDNILDPEGILSEKFPRLRLLLRHLSREKWPLQSDHIRIEESDIRNCTSQCFKVIRRVWIKHYLTFEFMKVRLPRQPT